MRRPDDRLTRIVDAALDGANGEGFSTTDEAKFAPFQRLAKSLKSGFFDPPQSAVDRAVGAYPVPERLRLKVRLLGSPLGLSGARLSAGQEAHALFEVGEARLRVMYARSMEGLEIMGQIDRPGWTASCGLSEVDCDDQGRFRFTARPAEETRIVFRSRTSEFDVPSFEELADDAGTLD